MFDNSYVSKRLFRYFNDKFGQVVTNKTILKCCVVVDCKLDRPRASLMDIATPRSLKSYTSNEVMNIFDDSFYIDIRSDWTMHYLKRYQRELKEGRCILVNDATTEFASKGQRTKDRLVSGLSELLADEIYEYGDFENTFTLEGSVTLIMNITLEAYKNYKDRLFGLTFGERFVRAFHTLTPEEQREWVQKRERVKALKFGRLIKEDDIQTEVSINPKYYRIIEYLAQDWSYRTLTTLIGSQDLIKAILMSHASLNNRRYVCKDDLDFVNAIMDEYLVDPLSPNEGKIIKWRTQGFSYGDICKKLNKSSNYKMQAQRIVEKAILRGILPVEEEHIGIRSIDPRISESSIRPSEPIGRPRRLDSRNLPYTDMSSKRR